MEIKRVFDILEKLKTYAPKKDILNAKENKQWVNYSLDDFISSSDLVGQALIHLGLKPGDLVAIMASNTPQWNFVDYGCQKVGVVTAPIFPTISLADLKYILNHSEAKVIFISDRAVWQKLVSLEKELPHLNYVFSFNAIEGVKHFSEFLDLGRKHNKPQELAERMNRISEDDLLTILYTSGTTGQPKGAMLSHKNMIANVMVCKDIAPFTNQWRALSFLPLNHVYERFLNTLYLFHGVSIYYAESFETIGDNCREIQPQLFVAVPRVLEVVLDKISSTGEKLTGFKKKIFNWSMRLGENYELFGKSPWYHLQRKIADLLVYKKWRQAIGGKIVIVVSGGAALNPRLERIFYCAGIDLLQGYGLTETCVVLSVNRIEKNRRMFGTVGIVVENSEVKIAEEDGEILMKGPSLMLGYYKNPEATAEAIDQEGWFHTGDVGTIVDGKFLKITDRKKEIFKTSAGKYVSPVAIENKLKECKYIEQCMVVGEGEKFVSAIIVPALSRFKDYCQQHAIYWEGNEAMFHHATLRTIISDHVKKVNSTLAPFEQLKRQQLIFDSWTVENGEITPKLSLKRKVIFEKNKEVIKAIYGAES